MAQIPDLLEDETEDAPDNDQAERQLMAFTKVLLQRLDVAAGPSKLLWGPQVPCDTFVASLTHFFTQEGAGTIDRADLLARTTRETKAEQKFRKDVTAARRQIAASDKKVVQKLALLFSAIDDRNLGFVTWEQFTTFLIDSEAQREEEHLVSMFEKVGTAELSRAWVHSTYHANYPHVLTTTMSQGIVQLDLASITTSPEVTIVHSFPMSHIVLAEEYMPGSDLIAAVCEVSLMFLDASLHTTYTSGFTFEQLEDSPCSLKYHPRMNLLFVGCTMGHVAVIQPPVYNQKTREYNPPVIVNNFHPTRKTITSMCFLPGEAMFVVGTESSHVLVMGTRSGVVLKSSCLLNAGLRRCNFALFNDFSNYVVCGGDSVELYMLNVTSSNAIPIKLRDVTNPHLCRVVAMVSRDNSAELFSIDSKGNVKIWDMSRFACTQTISCGDMSAMYTGLYFDYNLRQLIAISRRKIFRFAVEKAVHQKDNITHVITIPSSGIILGCTTTNAFVWNVRTGKPVVTYVNICAGDISAVCIIPPGTSFALGTRVGSVAMFNITTGRKIAELLRASEFEITSLAYCKVASRIIATSLGDEVLYLYMNNDSLRCFRVGFERDRNSSGTAVAAIATAKGESLVCVGSASNGLSWFSFRWPCTVREMAMTELERNVAVVEGEGDDDDEGDGDSIERQVSSIVYLPDLGMACADTCGRVYLVETSSSHAVLCSWSVPDPQRSGTEVETESRILVTCLAYYAQCQALYVALETGHLQVYSMTMFPAPPPMIHQWHGHKDTVTAVSIDHVARVVVTTGHDLAAKVWTLNGEPIANLLTMSQPYQLSYFKLEFTLRKKKLLTGLHPSGIFDDVDVVVPKAWYRTANKVSNANAIKQRISIFYEKVRRKTRMFRTLPLWERFCNNLLAIANGAYVLPTLRDPSKTVNNAITTVDDDCDVSEEIKVLWRRSDFERADELEHHEGDTPRTMWVATGGGGAQHVKTMAPGSVPLKFVRRLRAQKEWGSKLTQGKDAKIERKGRLRVGLCEGGSLTPQPWKITEKEDRSKGTKSVCEE